MLGGGRTISAGIGIPHGAGHLMRDDDFVQAVQQIARDVVEVETPGSGTADRDWATISAAGAIVVQTARGTMSVSKLETGTYQVTRNSAFPTISSETGAAPQVTPRSLATVSSEATVTDFFWFTTTNPNNARSIIGWDSLKEDVWATDYDHDTAFTGNPDRIAIGSPFNALPEVYLYLPTGFTNLNQENVGDTLILDMTYRLAFVQARNNDGSQETTLIYDIDSLAVVFNCYVDIGGPNACRILGHSDDYFIIKQNADWKIFSRDADGLPDTSLGTYAGSPSGTGYKDFLVDNNGHFWGVNSTTPKDWVLFPISGGYTAAVKDGGAEGIMDRIYDFNPNDNSIYFMTNFDGSDCILKKISCDSPYTVTTIATYSSTYDAGTADETLQDITTLKFTPDYQHLIAVRGGDSANYPHLFVVDPDDGSLDAAISLPSPYSNNYGVEGVVVLGEFVVTMGNQVLQVINYVLGGVGSDLDFIPPLFGARMSSTTSAIVEFWNPEALPARVKMDCGFHIEFSRD